ncbi:MAG: hypothetical protein M1825_000517 [Sarcosagium campestre]|nr:MAG: hypothetical protein M1825_000517 [Sarcosagium campestre]
MAAVLANPPVVPEYSPPPWTCKCSSYWLPFYSTSPSLPENAYSPLEAAYPGFSAENEAGAFRGGLGMVQLVRYSDTPAGAYDELLVIPGAFDVPGTGSKNSRITRIYVSQNDTLYNGTPRSAAQLISRKIWGIPKHIARFSFTHPPASPGVPESQAPLKVEVFPPSAPEGSPPFFKALLQPFTWTPSLPFSTKTLPYVGIDAALVQPPLPADPDWPELAGTQRWLKTLALLQSPRTKGMWVQTFPADPSVAEWWPAVKPWRFGMWLEDATLSFPVPEVVR